MLQQTQVDRVLPKYHEWLGKYPSFAVLAEAKPAEVTKTWYPLGYNIRPRRLQSIAQQAVAKYKNKLSKNRMFTSSLFEQKVKPLAPMIFG